MRYLTRMVEQEGEVLFYDGERCLGYMCSGNIVDMPFPWTILMDPMEYFNGLLRRRYVRHDLGHVRRSWTQSPSVIAKMQGMLALVDERVAWLNAIESVAKA